MGGLIAISASLTHILPGPRWQGGPRPGTHVHCLHHKLLTNCAVLGVIEEGVLCLGSEIWAAFSSIKK